MNSTQNDTMSEKKLKAYVVREDGEGNCAVVFATNGATARRNGANELNMEFEEVESCCREPAFDQYAPGPVPLHATLAAGWWHECTHCGVRFDEDDRRYYDDEEREDAFEPMEDAKHQNFCSPTCMMEHWAKQQERKARESAIIEAALVRWPTATNVTAGEYCKAWPSRDNEWRARFTLPGLRYPVSWVIGEPSVAVSACDVEEFQRLYGIKDPS